MQKDKGCDVGVGQGKPQADTGCSPGMQYCPNLLMLLPEAHSYFLHISIYYIKFGITLVRRLEKTLSSRIHALLTNIKYLATKA